MENSFFEFRASAGVRESAGEGAGSAGGTDSEAIEDSLEESFSVLRGTPARARARPRARAPHAVVHESDHLTDDEDDDMDVNFARSKSSPKVRQPRPITCSTSDEEEVADTPERKHKPKCFDVAMDSPLINLKKTESTASPITRVAMDISMESPLSALKKGQRIYDSPLANRDVSMDSPAIGRRKGKPAMILDSDTDEMTPDDDLVMSAATRMSITGIKPKVMLTDESDFIDSDEDLPEVDLSQRIDHRTGTPLSETSIRGNNSQNKTFEYDNSFSEQDKKTKVSLANKENCINAQNVSEDHSYNKMWKSPVKREPAVEKPVEAKWGNSLDFVKNEKSPLNNDSDSSEELELHDIYENVQIQTPIYDPPSPTYSSSRPKYVPSSPTYVPSGPTYNPKNPTFKEYVKKERESGDTGLFNEQCEVQIVENNHDVIALSSDEEEMASMSTPKALQQPTIKKYFVPESYPGGRVVYVSKARRDNELNALEGLRHDLQQLKLLMKKLDVTTLPDRGRMMELRLQKLQAEIKTQGDKVASMIVEPDRPTAADIARDGFATKTERLSDDDVQVVNDPNERPRINAKGFNAGPDGLSWEDLQAASKMVQPKMFGKQAMSTHLAERSEILDRLRDLQESYSSRPTESEHAPQPRGLRVQLMPHQTHALAWLKWRETQKPRGGILADDMGLGKTLTMISLVVAEREHLEEGEEDERDSWNSKGKSKLIVGGTLVVCPASLLQQWAGEVARHCDPHLLSVCQHHGQARATQPYKLSSYDMVITTYNIVSRDFDKGGVLMKLRWSRVILDEAHIVRNHKSITANAVCALEGHRRWCLTGTPVQNKELDVFALVKFMKCTPFDEMQMWKKWIDNKSAGGQERMAVLMRCLLLRRTKQQLEEAGELTCLPQKTKELIEVKMLKEEMNVYQKVLMFSKSLFAQFLHQREERHAEQSQQFLGRTAKDDFYAKKHKEAMARFGGKQVKSHEILVLLLRLRQLCCHPGLIAAMLDPESSGDMEEEAGAPDILSELSHLNIEETMNDSAVNPLTGQVEEGTSVTEAMRSVLSCNNPVFNLGRESSKIAAVVNCLQEQVFTKPDEKAVVVSQWTSVLSIVERVLRQSGVECATLSGKVPVPARAQVVDSFNDPRNKVKVLLLSLCAGGVGLNLCGGNHLLLLDPHWNPQLEEQAQDRIYRVGQKKPVHIYKFMTVDTVEQSIKKLQEYKLELATNVLTGAKNTKSSKLTIEDLKMLFNMHEDQPPSLPNIPQQRSQTGPLRF